jgi:hypothetical protein
VVAVSNRFFVFCLIRLFSCASSLRVLRIPLQRAPASAPTKDIMATFKRMALGQQLGQGQQLGLGQRPHGQDRQFIA